jgi:hypothetical protein
MNPHPIKIKRLLNAFKGVFPAPRPLPPAFVFRYKGTHTPNIIFGRRLEAQAGWKQVKSPLTKPPIQTDNITSTT